MKSVLGDFIVYYKSHKGRVNGAILGFLFALAVILFGLLGSIFIALCVLIGYYIGKKLENDKKFVRRLLDKLFPPGRYR